MTKTPPFLNQNHRIIMVLDEDAYTDVHRCEHLGGPVSHHGQPLDYANRMMLQEPCTRFRFVLLCVCQNFSVVSANEVHG